MHAGTVRLPRHGLSPAGLRLPDCGPRPRRRMLAAEEEHVIAGLVRSFAESERLQRHVQFLYAHGALYKIVQRQPALPRRRADGLRMGGSPPCGSEGAAVQRQAAGSTTVTAVRGMGYFAPEGSLAAAGRAGFFVVSVVRRRCRRSMGRSAMTTFERLYIADPATTCGDQRSLLSADYRPALDMPSAFCAEFGLTGAEQPHRQRPCAGSGHRREKAAVKGGGQADRH